MADRRNPLDRTDGRNPHREPLRVSAFVEDEELVPVIEALLSHQRHGFDLSHVEGVQAALEAVRSRLLDGEDLPEPRSEGLAEWLGDLAEAPVLPETEVPPPEPAALPEGLPFVQRLLRQG